MKRRNHRFGCPRIAQHDIEEIKSVPHVPMSHPFVERLIGSIRRELLDHTLFWTATDLENKLRDYQRYYNDNRTHSGRDGNVCRSLASDITWQGVTSPAIIQLSSVATYSWLRVSSEKQQ
jgi:hypothetical protein